MWFETSETQTTVAAEEYRLSQYAACMIAGRRPNPAAGPSISTSLAPTIIRTIWLHAGHGEFVMIGPSHPGYRPSEMLSELYARYQRPLLSLKPESRPAPPAWLRHICKATEGLRQAPVEGICLTPSSTTPAATTGTARLACSALPIAETVVPFTIR